MGFFSLGRTMFILALMMSFQIVAAMNPYLNHDGTFNEYPNAVNIETHYEDTGRDTAEDALDRKPSELEQQGANFGRLDAVELLWNTILTSSYNFYSFFANIFKISSTATPSGLILLMVAVYINLNHLFVIAQMIPGFSFGGNL